ncbi:MAG: hypothetical protein R3307_06405 [Anaerolineales bacterium]|nr:hypothetical protein [Anaerolineales bacterium]
MENWLATSPWPGVILWIILYTSDYYLTILSARGFREVGNINFEGSFELTPQYQKDVDALAPISRRHIVLLLVYSLAIYLLWLASAILIYIPWAYQLYLGMFLLIEVAVHMRHLRNLFLIRQIRREGGVDGQITYRRWFTYKISAFDLNLFGILFLIVAAVTFSPFFLGGAIMCFGTGFKHYRLAKKTKSVTPQTVEFE